MARVMRRWSGSCGSTSPPMTRPCMKGRVSKRAHSLLPLISKPGRRRPATPITNAAAPSRTRRTSTTESSANPSIETRASREAGHYSRTYMASEVRTRGSRSDTLQHDAAVVSLEEHPCAAGSGDLNPGVGTMNTRTANQISGVLGMLASLWAIVGTLASNVEGALEDPVWACCGGSIPQLPAPVPGHWSKAQRTRQALEKVSGPGCWQATRVGRVTPVTLRERT